MVTLKNDFFCYKTTIIHLIETTCVINFNLYKINQSIKIFLFLKFEKMIEILMIE